ncbi:MAG: NADP-dependent phosphogluconate dehydrogenase [Myxococcales bacterium]|nr:NADP-dependent phosphogluconate dehydrogenase [Myxococcales bacterium]
MSNATNDIAIIGMGVMGANLARNFASRGLSVGIYNRTLSVADRVVAKHPEAKFDRAETLDALVAGLKKPRRIIAMISAGSAVDAVLDSLDPLLEEGDIVVDAGNSHFADTERRCERANKRTWRFMGMGVSGGAEGALLGPSIMPGGDEEAWNALRPILESAAAQSDSGSCVAYCGTGSAGHFVKMVHNGIEYGDMQLIAESAVLMRQGLGMPSRAVADTFSAWNKGDLDSFLIEITADIFRTPDPKDETALLVDAILDKAGQKGTGCWTVLAAVELGVAIPTITAAVDARALSAQKALRITAEAAFAPKPSTLSGVSTDDVRDALYAAKIATYTQGFAMLRTASDEKGYGSSFGEVSRIWKEGCIIRAGFLDRVREAFVEDPELSLLALAPSFQKELAEKIPCLRRVTTAAIAAGLPVPGLAASLSYFDTLACGRGSANLIQAQRDYFGSHTYERLDEPGISVHTDWANSKRS